MDVDSILREKLYETTSTLKPENYVIVNLASILTDTTLNRTIRKISDTKSQYVMLADEKCIIFPIPRGVENCVVRNENDLELHNFNVDNECNLMAIIPKSSIMQFETEYMFSINFKKSSLQFKLSEESFTIFDSDGRMFIFTYELL